MTGCVSDFYNFYSIVSLELTGGDRTIHDVGAYSGESFTRIAVVGARGHLNCPTSGTYY